MEDQTIIDLYDSHAPGVCRVVTVAMGAGSGLIVSSAWGAGGAAAAAGATVASGGTVLLVAAGVLMGAAAAHVFCPGMVEKGRGKVQNLMSKKSDDHQYRFITAGQFDAFHTGLASYGAVSRDDALVLARLAYATIAKNGSRSCSGKNLGNVDFPRTVRSIVAVYRGGPTAAAA